MIEDPAVRPPTDAERSAEQAFRVRFEEAGPAGTIRTSTLLRYAAELAGTGERFLGAILTIGPPDREATGDGRHRAATGEGLPDSA